MNISNSTDFEPVSDLQSYGTLSAASFGFIFTSFTLFGMKQSKFENCSARILAQKLVAHLFAFIMFGFRPLSAKNWSVNPPPAEFVKKLENILFCLTCRISLYYVGILVYFLSIVVHPTLQPYNSRRLELAIAWFSWIIPLTLICWFVSQNEFNEPCTPSIFNRFEILSAITFFLWVVLMIAIKEKFPRELQFSSMIIAEHTRKLVSQATIIMVSLQLQILPFWFAADGQRFGISCDLDYKLLTQYSIYFVIMYSMDNVLLYCFHGQLRAWMTSKISRLFRFAKRNQTEQNNNSIEMTNVA